MLFLPSVKEVRGTSISCKDFCTAIGFDLFGSVGIECFKTTHRQLFYGDTATRLKANY